MRFPLGTTTKTICGLVPDLDQVVAQLLHGVGRGARLHALWVVRDEDGLRGLDENDTFAAL